MLSLFGLLNSSINTCTFATDGTGDITVASAHGRSAGDEVRFSTTGALPSEISLNGRYIVLSAGLTSTKLRISLTAGGSTITFAAAGTGTHTIWRTTLSGEYQFRGIGFIAPGRPTQAPSHSWAQVGLLETLIGGCDFSSTTITVLVPHGLSAGQTVRFSGLLLNTPLTAGVYYVLSSGLTTTQLQVSSTLNGVAINFGSPANDVFLYDGRPNVSLRTIKATIWKSTLKAAFTTGSIGFYGKGYVFSGAQAPLTVTESLSLADSARTAFVSRSVTESLSTADSPILRGHATVSETLVISDTNIAHAPNLYRIAVTVSGGSDGDDLRLFDNALDTLPKLRFVSEALALFDFPSVIRGPRVTATEALSLSLTAVRPGSGLRTTFESLLLAGALHEAHVLHRFVYPFVESLGTRDAAGRTAAFRRATAEALALSEFTTGAQGAYVLATESLLSADLLSRVVNRGRSAAETLLLADLLTAIGAHRATASETLVIADSPFGQISRLFTAAESLHFAEVATFAGTYHRNPVESLLVSDVALRRVTLLRIAFQFALKLVDVPQVASRYSLSAQEALLIEQFASWITAPRDPWEYYLDLTAGNHPLQSNLASQEAQSGVSAPDAESELGAPEAESGLVGTVASSGFRYILP